jgi:hypothetical protein
MSADSGGVIDAFIGVVDSNGKAVMAESLSNTLANNKAINELIAKGITELEVKYGRLVVKGNVTEAFDIVLDLDVYETNPQTGDRVDERAEKITLRFIPAEQEGGGDPEEDTLDPAEWTKELTSEATGTYLLRIPLHDLTSAETALVTGINVSVTNADISDAEAVFEDGGAYLLVTLTTTTPETAAITGIDFNVGGDAKTYSFANTTLGSIPDAPLQPAPSGGGGGGCVSGASALALCAVLPMTICKRRP